MPDNESIEDRLITDALFDSAAGDRGTSTSGDGRDRAGIIRSRADVLAVIAVGGALGSLGRWGVGQALPARPDGFPWATFTENCTGALALGVLMVFVLDVWSPHRYLRPFLGVGVLGGYTTFSTYMLDARDLLAAGHEVIALTYVAGTLLAGLVAVWVGIVAARALVVAVRRRGLSHADRSPRAASKDHEELG